MVTIVWHRLTTMSVGQENVAWGVNKEKAVSKMKAQLKEDVRSPKHKTHCSTQRSNEKRPMCGQHKERAGTSMYFSVLAPSMGN